MFTFELGNKVNIVMWLDEASGEAKQLVDQRLDFKDTRTVLVKKALYAFKDGSPVSVYKYTDFTSIENLVKTTLSTLPRNEFLKWFTVTQMKGSIVLTGGEDNEGVYSAKTFLMDLQMGKW